MTIITNKFQNFETNFNTQEEEEDMTEQIAPTGDVVLEQPQDLVEQQPPQVSSIVETRPEDIAKEPKETPPKKEDMISVSAYEMKELLSLMAQTLAQLNSKGNVETNMDTKTLVNAIKESLEPRRRGMFAKMLSVEEIPMEDLLPRPVLFFAFCHTTTIYDDVKNGHDINMPFKPVKFAPLLRYEDPVMKGKMITQCCAVVHSKKQAEFIRKHSLFGVKYFEKREDTKAVSSEYAEKLVRIHSDLSRMSEFEIKQKCINSNIHIDTPDVNELRKKLAKVMAMEQLEEDNKRAYQEVNDTFESVMIRNSEDVKTQEKVYS